MALAVFDEAVERVLANAAAPYSSVTLPQVQRMDFKADDAWEGRACTACTAPIRFNTPMVVLEYMGEFIERFHPYHRGCWELRERAERKLEAELRAIAEA